MKEQEHISLAAETRTDTAEIPVEKPAPISDIDPPHHWENSKERTAMLDVHPAHHAASTWRDFFIHIATIAVGLLIAVGLEQTVEFFHHRHQVAETREALRVEREININRFAIATAEFRRFAPILQSDLNILVYIHDHPGAKFVQLPARLNWYTITVPFNDSAWKTAQQSGVLQYMPRDEVQRYSQLYDRLTRLAFRLQSERDALFKARGFTVRDADPTHLSPAELDHQLELMTDVVLMHGTSGGEQRNINRLYPDFTPAPSANELYQVLHSPPAPEDVRAVSALSEQIDKFDAEHGEAIHDSSSTQAK